MKHASKGVQPSRWNPGQTSSEVQKRGISSPIERTDVLQNLKKNYFWKFFKKIFEGHQSFFVWLLIPCFGLLLTSALGVKSRVDSLACVFCHSWAADSSDSLLVRHLLTSWRPAWWLNHFDPHSFLILNVMIYLEGFQIAHRIQVCSRSVVLLRFRLVLDRRSRPLAKYSSRLGMRCRRLGIPWATRKPSIHQIPRMSSERLHESARYRWLPMGEKRELDIMRSA